MEKPKRTVDPEGKKEAILVAATAAFARLGIEAASTADIAKTAGCGIGTVFRIFPTKENLINAVFQRACELHAHYHDKSKFDADDNTSPREQFHRLFHTGVDMVEYHANEYLVFEQINRAECLTELSNHMAAQLRRRIIRWLDRLRQNKAIINVSSDIVFAITIGSFVRLVHETRRVKSIKPSEEFLASLEEVCWRGIVQDPAPNTDET